MIRASFRMQRTRGEFGVRPGAHANALPALLHRGPQRALAHLCRIQAQAASTRQ